ncbi:transcriptional regulator STERILE APETALA-like [Prosopis cineraria]|uniref:transcriptional regulator STERILE APETALA-like n=1 Tax=Prosopis cineraria TaxID=364024 RepID=UPI00241038B8|nr:transcriptional regulator STERILE APETALA-like [Prosopis cineraria]
MSSSSPSSSSFSSSSSPSIPDDTTNHGNNNNNSGGGDSDPGPSTSRRRRRRPMNEVLPEPFLEALAIQIAIEASHTHGRLAAAPSIANLFQVCSTWRAISRSDHLWQRLTQSIWRRTHRIFDTWHEEFNFWHRTASNFVTGRYAHTSLRCPFDLDRPHLCRCLTLSDNHLACGFADGTVRLYDLQTRAHVITFRPHHVDVLGPFSRSVSGIIITNSTLVFATLDGNIYAADINGPPDTHMARPGDVLNNGVLVEFAGSGRWWVGLFAGVPRRAFRVWDARGEQPDYIGGSLTDPDSVQGWHMLTDVTEPVGRLRVTTRELAVACTRSRLVVFDLRNPGVLLRELVSRVGFIVTSLDVSHEAFVIVESRGRARVRRASTFEPECEEFMVTGTPLRGMIGCMNLGYVLICAGGHVRLWDVEPGEAHLGLTINERIGSGMAMAANDRHVVVSCRDTSIHLWDFGVQ